MSAARLAVRKASTVTSFLNDRFQVDTSNPVDLPAVVTLELVFVRSLLDRAISAYREGTDIGRMTAMLVADIACEAIAKQALVHRGIQPAREARMQDLTTELAKAIPALGTTPTLQNALRLRNARNPVQHSGQVPADSAVSLHLADAEAFISLVSQEAFGVDFRAVSAAILVRLPDLRWGLVQALALIEQGDLDDANVWASAVFEIVRARWEFWLVRSTGSKIQRLEDYLPLTIRPALLKTFGPKHSEAAPRQYPESSWRPEMTILTLGFPPPELIRIRALIERAEAFFTEEKRAKLEPLPTEEVEFFVEALARQIWRIESTQPDMLKPTRPLDYSEVGVPKDWLS
jgi:hypothetical protein